MGIINSQNKKEYKLGLEIFQFISEKKYSNYTIKIGNAFPPLKNILRELDPNNMKKKHNYNGYNLDKIKVSTPFQFMGKFYTYLFIKYEMYCYFFITDGERIFKLYDEYRIEEINRNIYDSKDINIKLYEYIDLDEEDIIDWFQGNLLTRKNKKVRFDINKNEEQKDNSDILQKESE